MERLSTISDSSSIDDDLNELKFPIVDFLNLEVTEPSIFGTLAKDKSPARDENKRRSMPQTPSFANLFKAVEGESTMPKMCNGHVTSSETSSNVVESEEIEKDKEIIVKIAFIR
ncbi:uncharacterized protein LOC117112352 isoform X2 [Anneissia japonica]|uniref:uncharacterized protein LOC117112352 isoform X2 n=1 Tax=Anneissia japonica TaxID=1529436 RepID=UPI0014256240|nr:uncharacterized protein LOC117112352 isoform X2 [Anneissia japonica]